MLLEGCCKEASLHQVRVAGTLPRGRPSYTAATALQTDDSYIRRHLNLPRQLGLNEGDADAPPLPHGARIIGPGPLEPVERSRVYSFIEGLTSISVSADDDESSGDDDVKDFPLDPQRVLHRALIRSAEEDDDGDQTSSDSESYCSTEYSHSDTGSELPGSVSENKDNESIAFDTEDHQDLVTLGLSSASSFSDSNRPIPGVHEWCTKMSWIPLDDLGGAANEDSRPG
ncbi:hypothetical protein FOL47_000462, partial [Perkinsus chesapeaki]